MEYEKFKEQFVEDLKERLEAGGEKFSVDLNAVQKMNQNYEAVTVKPEDALKYAPVMRPAVIQTMAETLLEMMGPEAKDMIPVLPDDPLFVATVPDKIQGAGVLAYQDFMEQAAERVGGDFFILPSSIHEILLVRDDGTFDINHLEDMVKQVNETEVAPEDLLTDSVYHYDSKEKIFELAEKYEERVANRKRESTLDKLQEKSREHITKDIGSRPIARGGEAL